MVSTGPLSEDSRHWHTWVLLTDAEMEWARTVGARRQEENVAAGLRDKYGAARAGGANLHVLGAIGEITVAHAMKYQYGYPQDVFKGKDYGPYQVRTRRFRRMKLLLHPDDADNDVFIAVYGIPPEMWIAGWCYGAEGKARPYWQDPLGGRPCYFVPNAALHDFVTLPKMLEDQQHAG